MTALTTTTGPPAVAASDNLAALLLRSDVRDMMMREAKELAQSDLLPDAFRNKPANCLIAVDLAHRLQMPAWTVMQNCYIVKGTPGFSGKFIISLVNTRGPFDGPIEFEYEHNDKGEATSCTAVATYPSGKEVRATVSWDMVVKEQWNKNPKWTSMREQMFAYRSAAFLARRYCPEVLMGMELADEREDVRVGVRNEASAPEPKAIEDLNAALDEGERQSAQGEVVDMETGEVHEPAKKTSSKKKASTKKKGQAKASGGQNAKAAAAAEMDDDEVLAAADDEPKPESETAEGPPSSLTNRVRNLNDDAQAFLRKAVDSCMEATKASRGECWSAVLAWLKSEDLDELEPLDLPNIRGAFTEDLDSGVDWRPHMPG